MGLNSGLERKTLTRQWSIMRKQHEDAGMSPEVIQSMYEYDRSCLPCPEQQNSHAGNRRSVHVEQGEELYSHLVNKYHEVRVRYLKSCVAYADAEYDFEHYLHASTESIRQSAIQLFSEAFSA